MLRETGLFVRGPNKLCAWLVNSVYSVVLLAVISPAEILRSPGWSVPGPGPESGSLRSEEKKETISWTPVFISETISWTPV